VIRRHGYTTPQLLLTDEAWAACIRRVHYNVGGEDIRGSIFEDVIGRFGTIRANHSGIAGRRHDGRSDVAERKGAAGRLFNGLERFGDTELAGLATRRQSVSTFM